MARIIYFAITKKDPWQPACDQCRGPLARPFYWTKQRARFKTICEHCHTKTRLIASITRSMYGKEPADPRYA